MCEQNLKERLLLEKESKFKKNHI